MPLLIHRMREYESKLKLVNVLVHSSAAAGSFWRLEHHGNLLPSFCPESRLNDCKQGGLHCGN